MELGKKRCKPCEGGVPALNEKEIADYMAQIHEGWRVVENMKITREYSFINFRHTMDFVNKVAELAEDEGHHPDMFVSYGKVRIELWTHSIGGLSENDFIVAWKIDEHCV